MPKNILPPPRTIGELRALLQTALDMLTNGKPLRAPLRADVVALLKAALRYRKRRSDG